MAKGQIRSNKEVRKPKKPKVSPVAPSGLTKGILAASGPGKKKG